MREGYCISFLECDPGLFLIGVSSDSNLVKMWIGRQMYEMSIRDLLKVIHTDKKPADAFSPRG